MGEGFAGTKAEPQGLYTCHSAAGRALPPSLGQINDRPFASGVSPRQFLGKPQQFGVRNFVDLTQQIQPGHLQQFGCALTAASGSDFDVGFDSFNDLAQPSYDTLAHAIPPCP